jgi:hypothetical protein
MDNVATYILRAPVRTTTTLLLALMVPAVAGAQPHHAEGKPALTAVRIAAAPDLDGALDEEVWSSAPVAGDFVQQEPREGEPATERTEVRVAYDARNLYIGIRADDSMASGIIATEMRRDSDRLLDEDNVQIILDTFHDQRSGYMFVTTPLGARLEQQVSDDGEGGGRGSNSAVNRNWDGVWEAAARIGEGGWSAEIAIPLSTLRFRPGDEQTWGINFMRNIRRKNEQVYWSPVGKAYALTRVSSAGVLDGLRSISQGQDLRFKPFVLSGLRDRATSPALSDTSFLREFGADFRYGVTPGLNLDVTYNTDFAQVEVDEQQVNLTRFGLFFPEKREFFLENAGLFTMGTGQSFTSTPVTTDLFFSRRIGLSATGQPVPIIGGGRLAGKVGAHNIGLLNIQTEEAFDRSGNNFLVGRYSRDVFSRSRIGALFINKEAASDDPHYNRTMGADVNLALGAHTQVMSFVAKTATPGMEGKDLAWSGRIVYRDPAWNLWLNYLDVQDNFNPEVGFVQRRGIRATKAYFSPTPRPGRARIRLMEPMFVLTYITDQENRMVGRTQHFMVGTRFEDESSLNVIYERHVDVLDAPFNVQPTVSIPIGTYNFYKWMFSFSSNPAARVYGSIRFEPQQYYGGDRRGAMASLGFRASTQFSTEISYERNDVDLPWGDFLTNLAILRADYAFSPRTTLRTLLQYNSSTKEVTSSIRFNFIHRPGSDLYIVYNGLDRTGLEPNVFVPHDRQLVVKFNYLLSR